MKKIVQAVQAESRKTASTEAKFIRKQNKKVGLDIVKVDLHICLRLMELRLHYSELPVLGKEWYYKLLMLLIIPCREKQLKKKKKKSSSSNSTHSTHSQCVQDGLTLRFL